MTTLEQIRQTFPSAKYAPDPNCSNCGGTGIHARMTATAQQLTYAAKGARPCLCVFFGPNQATAQSVLTTLINEKDLAALPPKSRRGRPRKE